MTCLNRCQENGPIQDPTKRSANGFRICTLSVTNMYENGNYCASEQKQVRRGFPRLASSTRNRKSGRRVFLNHMTAHFVAPNTSPDIREAVCFRLCQMISDKGIVSPAESSARLIARLSARPPLSGSSIFSSNRCLSQAMHIDDIFCLNPRKSSSVATFPAPGRMDDLLSLQHYYRGDGAVSSPEQLIAARPKVTRVLLMKREYLSARQNQQPPSQARLLALVYPHRVCLQGQ